MATRASGFILAGGRSHRFGEDKARFPVDGIPMALRVFLAMEQAGLEPCFVARDRRLEDLGPVLVEDLSGPEHPLNGVVAALEAGGGILAPCDLPFLPAEAFARLPPDHVAEGCPLLGNYGSSWLERAKMYLTRGLSVHAFSEPAQRVSFPQHWLKNVNRRQDLDTKTP